MQLIFVATLVTLLTWTVSSQGGTWFESHPPALFKDEGGIWTIGDHVVRAGTTGDIPVPEDYFGEGAKRLAVWRPSNGFWHIKRAGYEDWGTEGNTLIQCGSAGDIPVPGNYKGDGTISIAVWRPSNGYWYIKGPGTAHWHNTEGNLAIQCGAPEDVPVPMDYFNEGRMRIAVWRPSNGVWYVKGRDNADWGASKGNLAIQCGQRGDIPVPGNYFGDGKIQFAVWRPSNGYWYIKGAGTANWHATEGNIAIQCGAPEDIPAPADYFNEGKLRIAVYRPSDGKFYIKGNNLNDWASSSGNIVIPREGVGLPGPGRVPIQIWTPNCDCNNVNGDDFQLSGVKYDLDSGVITTLEPIHAATKTIRNRGGDRILDMFTIAREVTDKSEFAPQSGAKIRIGTAAEHQIPYISGDKLSTDKLITDHYTHGKGKYDVSRVKESFWCEIAPHQETKCDAFILRNMITVPYKRRWKHKGSGTQCPPSHPYVYNDGQHCCASNKEKYYEPHGTKCDGSEITRESKCCEGDRYFQCPGGKCQSYAESCMCSDQGIYTKVSGNQVAFKTAWNDFPILKPLPG